MDASEFAEYFVLGYWSNPYSRTDDNEYFWMRGFDTRADAVAAGKRKQQVGQPTRFTDWVKGTCRVFSSREDFVKAANKVGMNPRLID